MSFDITRVQLSCLACRQHLFRGIYAQTTHAAGTKATLTFSILSQPYSWNRYISVQQLKQPCISISSAAERAAAAYFVQRGALSFGFTSSDFDGCLCQLSGVIYNSLPEERGGLSERYLIMMGYKNLAQWSCKGTTFLSCKSWVWRDGWVCLSVRPRLVKVFIPGTSLQKTLLPIRTTTTVITRNYLGFCVLLLKVWGQQ